MRPWKFLLPLLATSLCFAAQPDRITTIDSSSTFALPGSHHPKAQPEFDQGVVDSSLPLTNITLVTVPSAAQKQALDLLLAQQQIPGSAKYHKWLTPSQFGSQFGLSQNDLNRITAWLKSGGFTVQRVSASRNTVFFSGTAGQVEKAFGTEIHTYLVDGKKHTANASPVLLPSALNGVVAAVMGLHNFLPHPTNRFGKAALPRRNYYSSSLQGEFLAPGDIATNYDITPLYSAIPSVDGTGEKLAIIGQTDVYLSDINNFRTGFSLNPITGCSTNGSGIVTSASCNTTYFDYVLPTGTTDTGTTWTCGDLGEADLDIEWSGAIAQGAQIIFVNSPTSYDSSSDCSPTNSQGVNSALIYALQQNVAPVVSMSYGICELEGDTGGLDPILEQGAAQGITILNSSDDIMSAGCDFSPSNANPPFAAAVGGLAVSYPASSAYVTGVGGTEISLTDDGSSTYWGTTNSASGGSLLSYIPEIPWNDDVEIGEYCQGQTNNAFCTNDQGEGGAGWINLNGSGGTAQNVQSDIWISGGGGGASNCFTNNGTVCSAGNSRPSWQSGLSVSGAPATGRYVPDVSLMASPNFPGYIFCTQLSELGDSGSGSSCGSGGAAGITTDLGLSSPGIIGGTSVSSPVFAGIATLLNQYLNGASSTGLGNINPMLYTLAATSSNNAFHPITSGDNNVYCQKNTPSNQPVALQCPASGVMGYSASNSDVTTGYNLVNGLGSVDVNNLAVAWSAALVPAFGLSPSSTSLSTAAGATPGATTTITVTPTSSSPGMTVNFSSSSCSGLPSGGTCTFNPTSVNGASAQTVQVTIFVPANTAATAAGQPLSIKISGTASGTSTQTQSTTVTLAVSKTTESFTLAAQNASYSVTAGSSAQINLAVASSNGFVTGSGSNAVTALPLSFTCSGLPSEATGSFSPATGSDNCSGATATTSPANVTLTISTTAATTELRKPLGHGNGMFYALLLPGLFGIVLAAGSRTRCARLLGLIVVLGFSSLWLGSCGGSSSVGGTSNPGTPAGTYTITIGATTGGAAPLTNSNTPYTIKLIVTN